MNIEISPAVSRDILSDTERHIILRQWNDTARAVEPTTLPELSAAQARRTPDAVAVVFEEETLTYGHSMRAPISLRITCKASALGRRRSSACASSARWTW